MDSLSDRPYLTANTTLTLTLNSSCLFRTPQMALAPAPNSNPSQPTYLLTVSNNVYPRNQATCPSSSFAFSIVTTPYSTPTYQALYDPPILTIPAQGSSSTTVTLVHLLPLSGLAVLLFSSLSFSFFL
jgi:hypothetical protein